MKQNKKGITLIALVVTIVVLIILAAISINTLLGQNGILQKAKEAGEESKLATIKEEVNIAWAAVQTEGYTTTDTYFDVAEALQTELRKQDPEATVYNKGEILEIFYKETQLAIDYNGNIIEKVNLESIQWQDIQELSLSQEIVGLDKNGKLYLSGVCVSDMKQTILYQKKIKEIRAASATIIALDEEGKIYTWGSNSYGELGIGTNKEVENPVCLSEIEGNPLQGKKIVAIGYGQETAKQTRESIISASSCVMAIDSDGNLYTWGVNRNFQLGAGIEDLYSSTPICINTVPGSVLQGKKVKEVRCDEYYVTALDEDGKVYTWGDNYEGRLGDGTNKEYSNLPICISEIEASPLKGKKIVKIEDNAVIDDQGKLYTWGDNYEGALGDGTNKEYSNLPICISEIETSPLKGKKITQISSGKEVNRYRRAIDEEGKVYKWRTGNLLPICLNDEEGSILQNKKIKQVIATSDFPVLLDTEGNVYVEEWEIKNINAEIKIDRIKVLDSERTVLFGEKLRIDYLWK